CANWGVRVAHLRGTMMTKTDSGLYRESYEKDSCGFGLIASLADQPSHWQVETAMTSVIAQTHRAAIAGDGKTGDGSGLRIKHSGKFLRAVAAEAGIALEEQFAAGLVFLSRDPQLARKAREVVEAELARESLQLAGWRTVPTNPEVCGAEA